MNALVSLLITFTPAETATPAMPPARLMVKLSTSSLLVAVTATPRKPDFSPATAVR